MKVDLHIILSPFWIHVIIPSPLFFRITTLLRQSSNECLIRVYLNADKTELKHVRDIDCEHIKAYSTILQKQF